MTTILLISFSLFSTFSYAPEPFDLLQTHSMLSHLNFLMGDYTVLTDGVPVLPEGTNRIPGWDSFESLIVTNPLEAGLWSNGTWCLNFISAQVPDSSFSSRIGLLENTSERNRYSAYLRRPVFSELVFDLSIARDEADKDQELRLSLREFSVGGRAWQNDGSGHALWTSWSPSNAYLRLSFSRLYPGGRKIELIASGESNIAGLDAEAGFLTSYTEDSIAHGELRLLLRKSLGSGSLMCRGFIGRTDDSLLAGGTAGIILEFSAFALHIGHIYPPNDDSPFTLGVIDYGPAELSLALDNYGKFIAGCSVITNLPFAFLRTSARSITDTLEFSGTALPYFNWGANGHIYCGVSWEYCSIKESEDTFDLDAVSLFTLNRFAFIFGIEEILEDSRNYTFGIVWGFDDRYSTLDTQE